MPNLRSKIFSFILHSRLYFHRWGVGGGWGSGTQLFLVMPNLRSKFFPFILHSGLYFRRWGVWDLTFFGHAKFEVKNFSRGGEGSSSFSTHAFHIHTHAIQIRIVALCVSKSATKNLNFSQRRKIRTPYLLSVYQINISLKPYSTFLLVEGLSRHLIKIDEDVLMWKTLKPHFECSKSKISHEHLITLRFTSKSVDELLP